MTSYWSRCIWVGTNRKEKTQTKLSWFTVVRGCKCVVDSEFRQRQENEIKWNTEKTRGNWGGLCCARRIRHSITHRDSVCNINLTRHKDDVFLSLSLSFCSLLFFAVCRCSFDLSLAPRTNNVWRHTRVQPATCTIYRFSFTHKHNSGAYRIAATTTTIWQLAQHTTLSPETESEAEEQRISRSTTGTEQQ